MTSISLDIASEQVQKNATCHLIPCKINYSGSCNVSKYFSPYIRDEGEHLSCSLRGHPLKGQKIPVPDGYTGIILKTNKFSLDEKKRDLKPTRTFREFTSWNWDRVPSEDDAVTKALEWVRVAEALHRPVSEYGDQKTEKIITQVKRKHEDSD